MSASINVSFDIKPNVKCHSLHKVRVDLIEERDICSSASKRGRYRQQVEVPQQSTLAVPFVIIPMDIGEFNIHVKAAVQDSSLNDGIVKKLRVVVSGETVCSYEIKCSTH